MRNGRSSIHCSGDSKVLTELGSNKVEVIVLDDQKSIWGIRIWSTIQVGTPPNRAQNLENGSSVNNDNFYDNCRNSHALIG